MKLFTLLAVLIAGLGTAVWAMPVVRITQVQMNEDSVRVYFLPVPGAADYRAYATDNPKEVKYAGQVHLFAPSGKHWVVDDLGRPVFPYRTAPNAGRADGPKRIDVPNLNIEVNGLDPRVPVQIVVEAVDRLGPSPYSNLVTEQNSARTAAGRDPARMNAIANLAAQDDNDVMELLGSNAGPTDDGFYSVNGQGPPHAEPKVIAKSLPVLVRPTGIHALPSVPAATQVLFDTFGRGVIDEIPGTRNLAAGNVSYLMHSRAEWRIDFFNDDIIHSRPFIMNLHYMDVLFDGGTPGTNSPLHTAHGAMTMSPLRPADFSGGRMLHVTMEVDAHFDPRRWVGFNLAPWNDPLQNLYIEGRPINKTDTGFFVQFFSNEIASNLFEGPKDMPLAGSLGQAPAYGPRPVRNGYDGRGLDDRSRFDLFVTAQRYVVFENAHLIIDQKFPHPLPSRLQKVKVYFTHYLYHTGNEINDLKTYAPWEHFWISLFPWSDERHWDNMGYEVLPKSYAGASVQTLANLIRDSKSVKVEQASALMAVRGSAG